MTKLTSSTKKQITNDWGGMFPDLGIYKPMWLLRRCGPLLTGICLDRGSSGDEYLPKAHIHCLANASDGINLSLCQSLSRARTGSDNWIRVKWHEKYWREAATRMIQQSLLPLSGPIDLEHIVTAFRRYRDDFPEGKYMKNVYRDWLLTLAWTGRRDEVHRLLAEAEQDMTAWPAHIVERDGGMATWLEEMERITSKPQELRQVVTEQLVKNHADELPAVDISSWLV